MRALVVSAAALTLLAAPLAAQKAGTIELGAFGRQTWYDKDQNLEDKAGGGIRLGFFPIRNLMVEGSGSWIPTSTKNTPTTVDIRNWSARGILGYNINVKPVAFILGGGIAFNKFSPKDVTTTLKTSETGPMGLVGMRFGIGGFVSARIDGTYEYTSTPAAFLNSKDNAGHWGLQGGLSLMFPQEKAGAPKDSDSDGVPDTLDKCPNTPLGTAVDGTGCPLPKTAPADTDGDGVFDADDKCPNTPKGEAVDRNGCSESQKDDDKDGVMNNADRCPNTPMGEKVDANGCSDSQKDDDKDGVANSRDKCPNTPAGAAVDANGCAPSQRDSDGDGVTDDRDKCPSTKPGTAVDAVGCRLLRIEGGAPLILKGVNFETGKAILTEDSKGILDEVAASLLANPDVRVEIGGHTDNTGSAAVNKRLSAARAKAVLDYFSGKGVPANRMVAKGYGPTKPVASNKTVEGRAENRRVELKVIP